MKTIEASACRVWMGHRIRGAVGPVERALQDRLDARTGPKHGGRTDRRVRALASTPRNGDAALAALCASALLGPPGKAPVTALALRDRSLRVSTSAVPGMLLLGAVGRPVRSILGRAPVIVGRRLRHDMTAHRHLTARFELARQLRNDVPSPRRRRLRERLRDQNVDLGFGWPNGDDWSRTYVNSGWVFDT
jgi:hypothetical protein